MSGTRLLAAPNTMAFGKILHSSKAQGREGHLCLTWTCLRTLLEADAMDRKLAFHFSLAISVYVSAQSGKFICIPAAFQFS